MEVDERRTKRFAFVERLPQVVAIVNPYQVSPGALLVMTTRHAPTVLDLTDDEALALAGWPGALPMPSTTPSRPLG